MAGHKGALWMTATTRGVTAHGSMPELGVNAAYKAARAICRLEEFDFDVPQHHALGTPTLNVGTVHGGLNINSVPDRIEIGVDVRSVPGVDHRALRDRLAGYLGDEVELTPFLDVPAIYTDPRDAWMRTVADVMADVTGERAPPRTATFFSDASILTPLYGGAPTVILGPGEPSMAHQTNEYCRIERIEQALEAYGRLIRSWCGL
jgi:succinyl-diaminopimelate desuccinylase